MNACARLCATIDEHVAAASAPTSEDHRRLRWALSLFRSGQYRVREHAPVVRMLARKFETHPDEEVRTIAAALQRAVGDYRVGG